MNRFAIDLLLRTAGLALTTVLIGYLVVLTTAVGQGFWIGIGLAALAWQSISLYRYLTGVNRKLTRFLESVQYADFTSTFRADNGLGPSFQGLNQQFNTVMDAFRQVRAESETNLQFLHTIVQHVPVGLLVFDSAGQVELVNQAALRLLGLYRLRQLAEIETVHPGLSALLRNPSEGEPMLFRTSVQTDLSIRPTTVRLRGRLLTVVSLQNIQPELQQKELEAWQNLTSVLRHEIMNSITPIVSLVGTIRDIVDQDLPALLLPAVPVIFPPPSSLSSLYSPLEDLHLALSTIEKRGQGIMQFVDAYRHFTSIPRPNRMEVIVPALLKTVYALVRADAESRQIRITYTSPATLRIQADTGQIEMVLLNLIRNAMDSLSNHPDPVIELTGYAETGRVGIRVSDNGPGIEAAVLEKIFIPFFTTKKKGSGIGLSLSRQIMQAHDGQLMVQSLPGQGSVFTLFFD